MVLFCLVLVLVLFTLLRLVVVLVNYFYRPYLAPFEQDDNGKVSVVVCKGKSEASLVSLLHDLQNQTYSNVEVLVLCSSTDGKFADALSAFTSTDSRFKLLSGAIRADGSDCLNNSKMIVEKTSGSYVLFLDTDMRVGRNFISIMVANMKHGKLDILHIIPHHVTKSFSVKIAVHATQWLLLSLIPLRLIGGRLSHLFPLENGVSVMYNAEIIRGDNLTTGMVIPESIKCDKNSNGIRRLGLKSHTFLGRKDEILCSYPATYSFATKRLARWVFDFFSGKRWLLVSYAIFTTLGPFISLIVMPYPFTFAYLFSILLGRMLMADICEQSAWKAVLLFPFQQLALASMIFTSLHGSSSGQKC